MLESFFTHPSELVDIVTKVLKESERGWDRDLNEWDGVNMDTSMFLSKKIIILEPYFYPSRNVKVILRKTKFPYVWKIEEYSIFGNKRRKIQILGYMLNKHIKELMDNSEKYVHHVNDETVRPVKNRRQLNVWW